MHPPRKLLPHNHVTSLLVDKAKALWVGTRAGVARYRPGNDGWTRSGTEAGLADPFVKTLYEDEDGSILAGCQEGGVFRLGADGRWALILDKGERPGK